MADRGLGKPVTGPLQNAAAVQTASGIAGTIGNLERKLKEIEADIRADLQGKQEYENMIDRPLAQANVDAYFADFIGNRIRGAPHFFWQNKRKVSPPFKFCFILVLSMCC